MSFAKRFLVASIATAGLYSLACVDLGGNVYIVEGEVTDAQSGATLAGIAVNCTAELWGEAQEVSTVTDGFGTYICMLSPSDAANEEFPDTLAMQIVFDDIDGADQGGEYASMTKTVTMTRNASNVLDVQLELK